MKWTGFCLGKCFKLELKYREERISKINRVEDKLLLLILFFEDLKDFN